MGNNKNQFNELQFSPSYRSVSSTKSSVLRIALLFGSAAIALGMIIIPLMYNSGNRQDMQALFPQGVDMTTTGSVR
jgi:hypothetical protein